MRLKKCTFEFEMSDQKTHRGYLSSVLHVLIVLVFGFFNTSGHIISTIQLLPAQTELLVEQKNSIKDSSKPTPGKGAQHHLESSKRHSSSIVFTNKYLISYHSFISVRFHSQSEKFISFNSIPHFTQFKIIPKISDDPYKS